jgi:hypothetical protein
MACHMKTVDATLRDAASRGSFVDATSIMHVVTCLRHCILIQTIFLLPIFHASGIACDSEKSQSDVMLVAKMCEV